MKTSVFCLLLALLPLLLSASEIESRNALWAALGGFAYGACLMRSVEAWIRGE